MNRPFVGAISTLLAVLVAIFACGIAIALFIETALLIANEYIVAALIAVMVLLVMVLGTRAAGDEYPR